MVKHVQKRKQQELDEYLLSYTFSFENLLTLIGYGIKTHAKAKGKVSGAFRDGAYLGCPGKDIHFALFHMNDEQEDILIKKFTRVVPVKPPQSYEHVSACFRYIYGCFDKQGCLLSKKHQRMIAKFTWDEQNKFMSKLELVFKENKNAFGLLILYEMRAHRLGDRAIISGDASLLDDMINYYELSVSCFHQLRKIYSGYQHCHTPYFWCAKYLERYDKDRALAYHIKYLRLIEKYGRDGYLPKIKHSVKYIKQSSSNWKKLRKEIKNYKKKCFTIIRNSI